VRYVKETIISGQIHVFVVGVAEIVSKRSFEPWLFETDLIFYWKVAQRRSWTEVYNVIWEIPDDGSFWLGCGGFDSFLGALVFGMVNVCRGGF
jgi:hypothetical protein